ncbi:hypothetical protein RRG08_043406 [Elysia crispata]|uniref:Uncharacterized protein n=1 Tax=Elysia crispata TaxID=231223 RepID=A0AAE1ATW5_9GAST|nr:hypothetical protein RRG08_043406 [Elysia crispata]
MLRISNDSKLIPSKMMILPALDSDSRSPNRRGFTVNQHGAYYCCKDWWCVLSMLFTSLRAIWHSDCVDSILRTGHWEAWQATVTEPEQEACLLARRLRPGDSLPSPKPSGCTSCLTLSCNQTTSRFRLPFEVWVVKVWLRLNPGIHDPEKRRANLCLTLDQQREEREKTPEKSDSRPLVCGQISRRACGLTWFLRVFKSCWSIPSRCTGKLNTNLQITKILVSATSTTPLVSALYIDMSRPPAPPRLSQRFIDMSLPPAPTRLSQRYIDMSRPPAPPRLSQRYIDISLCHQHHPACLSVI